MQIEQGLILVEDSMKGHTEKCVPDLKSFPNWNHKFQNPMA